MTLSRRAFLVSTSAGLVWVAAGCGNPADDDVRLAGIVPSRYGEASSQVAELLVPDEFGTFPVVVIIHGGWWRVGWDRSATRELAADLVKHGYATFNIEYRLVGEEGGGWPGTFEDVAAAIDHLAERAPDYNLDLDRVVFLGHSAGGHLALWAAAREALSDGVAGANPVVVPQAVVALAPVADLVSAANQNLGDGAVQALLGGDPEAHPLVYLAASPKELVPLPVPAVIYHGTNDDRVPVQLTKEFGLAALLAGSVNFEDVDVVEIADANHFDVIDITGEVWSDVRNRMASLVNGQLGQTGLG